MSRSASRHSGLERSALDRVVRRILIYGGDRVLRTEEGLDVWPVARLLEALAA